MEKQERSSYNGSHENHGRHQHSAEVMIGKVDLSRGITEDCADGEGDRNDTKEMEKLARDDSGE